MDINEIKAFIETNADKEEVKSYVSGLVTQDRVESFLETDDGKKLLQPKLDSYFTKGLDSWKNNNLQKLVDEEHKKKYPEKSEKDLELEKLRADFEAMKNEANKKELTIKSTKIAQDKSLPLDILDYFIGKDETETTDNLTKLEKSFNKAVEKVVDERLKGGYKPPKNNEHQIENPWSKEHYNLTLQGKLLRENPELAEKFMKDK